MSNKKKGVYSRDCPVINLLLNGIGRSNEALNKEEEENDNYLKEL